MAWCAWALVVSGLILLTGMRRSCADGMVRNTFVTVSHCDNNTLLTVVLLFNTI